MFVVHLLLAAVHTPHQVSLILHDSEKNGSSSFLEQSDEVMLVFYFPLVPIFSVVKPASYVIARLRGPSRASSQCFLPNRKLSVLMIGCRTTVRHQFPQNQHKAKTSNTQVSPPRPCTFNHEVGVDLFEIVDSLGARYSILSAVCMGTTHDQAWAVRESESLGSP